MARNCLSVEMEETMRNLAFAIAVFCALPLFADEPGDVRGCYVTYLSGNGSFLYEPFLKVGDKESMSEDGASEIWGFRPWNLEAPDHEGKTHPVNIPDDRFVPLGGFKEVSAGSSRKRIKCPDGLWQ